MQIPKFTKDLFRKVRAAVLKAIATANAKEPKKLPFGERAGLKPSIVAAFEVALAKVKRRETPSTFQKTSHGARWYPRARGLFLNDFDKAGKPVTLRRMKPKRDKTVSARQAKRARTSQVRCAA